MKSGRKKIPITDEQETFIKSHFELMPATEIGKLIGVSRTKIQTVVRGLGLKAAKNNLNVDWNTGMWSDELHLQMYPR